MKTARVLLTCLMMTLLVMGGMSAFAQSPQRQGNGQSLHTIQDRNADGICDVCGQPVGSGRSNAQGQRAVTGKHFGPGDGTGNQGAGPGDGTGYGAQSGKRNGPQDGSGARIGRKGAPNSGTAQGGRCRGRRP